MYGETKLKVTYPFRENRPQLAAAYLDLGLDEGVTRCIKYKQRRKIMYTFSEIRNEMAMLKTKEENDMFCTIDVPNVETAALMVAMLFPHPHRLFSMSPEKVYEEILKDIAGGEDGFKACVKQCGDGPHKVRAQLRLKLVEVNAEKTSTTASWLKPQVPQVPREINGNEVICGPKGVKVGCVEVSMDELHAIIEKCEGT